MSFSGTIIRNAKMSFQKVTSSHLPVLLVIDQPKIKILLWNFVYITFVCIWINYIPFFIENFGLNSQVFSQNQNFYFWVKSKNIKIWYSNFVERLISRCLAFLDCVLPSSKLNILAAFKHLPFLPKMAKHDVTKMPLSHSIIDEYFLKS